MIKSVNFDAFLDNFPYLDRWPLNVCTNNKISKLEVWGHKTQYKITSNTDESLCDSKLYYSIANKFTKQLANIRDTQTQIILNLVPPIKE